MKWIHLIHVKGNLWLIYIFFFVSVGEISAMGLRAEHRAVWSQHPIREDAKAVCVCNVWPEEHQMWVCVCVFCMPLH